MTQENKEVTVEKNETEVTNRVETMIAGRVFKPNTDIIESDGELRLYMDMPGVRKEDVDVKLEKNNLTVNGKLHINNYADYQSLFSEYNLGSFSRSFEISNEIEQSKIAAKMEDGVLMLTLPKIPEKEPERIEIS